MDRFQASIRDFEDWLDRCLADCAGHPRLLEACRASALGGKRFRAVLVFASSDLAGVPITRAYPLAAAVEMIHAYSLVHDDLPALDNADLRRGQPTAHKRFGEAVAVLAGDALLTDAFAVLCQLDAPPAAVVASVSGLARAAGSPGMVSGQVADMLDLPAASDVAVVRNIHAKKTGALIEWSCLAPVRVWAPTWQDTVAAYASELGILFQVRDDLLDIDPAARQDKDRNADGKKSTYARLLGAKAAAAYAQDHLQICLRQAALLPPPHNDVFRELAEWTVGRLA